MAQFNGEIKIIQTNQVLGLERKNWKFLKPKNILKNIENMFNPVIPSANRECKTNKSDFGIKIFQKKVQMSLKTDFSFCKKFWL